LYYLLQLPFEKKLFYEFSLKISSKADSAIFSKNLANKFLTELTVHNIDQNFFEFLIKLWDIANEKEEGIEAITRKESRKEEEEGIRRRKMVTKKFEKITNVEMLWEVMEKSKRAEVLKICGEKLIQIYGSFAETVLLEQKQTVWTIFSIQIVKLLNALKGKNRKHIIRLMEMFILSFDGRKFLNSDVPSVQETTLLIQIKSSKREKKKKKIKKTHTHITKLVFLMLKCLKIFRFNYS
jgi:hypothetical protein